MGDLINLRRARKARIRAADASAAAERRALYGRTTAERSAPAKEAERMERTVEGARRIRPDGEA
jgi:hypothetical protein